MGSFMERSEVPLSYLYISTSMAGALPNKNKGRGPWSGRAGLGFWPYLPCLPTGFPDLLGDDRCHTRLTTPHERSTVADFIETKSQKTTNTGNVKGKR